MMEMATHATAAGTAHTANPSGKRKVEGGTHQIGLESANRAT